MNSPKISESLNRFFSVSNANSDFAANDVVNMRGGEAVKAGTFHKWNIFRRLGRSDDEIRANNDTRQQFLDGLKESFGLTETGKALVDRLADILGKDVFKPEDYSFKDGKLDCGQPLTAHRITAVRTAVTKKVNEDLNEKFGEITTKTFLLAKKIDGEIRDKYVSACGFLKEEWGEAMADALAGLRENVLAVRSSNEVDTIKFGLHSQMLSLSASLRIAFGKASIATPEDRDKMANDIVDAMKETSDDFAKIYEEHEKYIDEWCTLQGLDRQEAEVHIVAAALKGSV